MSAITRDGRKPGLTPGLERYHTAVKVEVASHNTAERIDLSADVWACSVGKTIKGAGRANLSLVPSLNYMNLLFPNDYINIYFDIGDGQGWTRVFFGLIDRIEEDFSTQENGTPVTTYHVICTDFTKIFDKVFVYFNPALANRADWLNADFAQGNIGGLAALSRGVVLSGSPADIIQNFIMAMMGFGTQMVLPESYRPRVSQQFRNSRRNFIRSQLNSPALRNAVDPEILETINSRLLSQTDEEAPPPLTQEELAEISIEGDEAVQRNVAAQADRTRADRLRNLAARELDETGAFPAFILDIMDIFTFVERDAIDGFRTALEILQNTGDLMSTIRQYSNEVVNELFFDLRPVKKDGLLSVGDDFSRDPDDWGGNVADGHHPAGIQYVPALVMREYPFSTIEKVDASNVRMTLASSDGRPFNYGVMWCGAIFSNEPNVPGRHVIRIPSVALDQQHQGEARTMADKHLDVAVLSESEIVKTRFGRSDDDLFNLFQMHSNAIMGRDSEIYLLRDLLPLITPIDIMRHGLRVREANTIFAYFPDDMPYAQSTTPTETEEEETVEEDPNSEFSTEVGPPILGSDGASFGVFYGGRRSGSSVSARYGYRQGTRSDTGAFWVFHNGIDISVTSAETVDGLQGAKGPPVRAIADGMVCVSAPNGVYNLYGECVVIRHPQFEVDGKTVYSSYHHLYGRNTSVVGNAENHRERRLCSSLARGRFQERRVNKGDIIGWMGKTGAETNGSSTSGIPLDPNRPGTTGVFRHRLPHLHFEIDFSFPPRNDAATPRIPYTAGAPTPSGTNPKGMDPDAFLLSKGVDIVAEFSSADGDGSYIDSEEGGGEDAVTDEPARDPAQRTEDDSQRQTTRQGNDIDNRSIRNMLARWTILQDVWYQHNKEYLSGSLTVRPAPEIRVGYRLDVPERSLSFYVEGVQQDWQHPNKLTTTLQVTRGQPNNPFPVYVLPPTEGLSDPSTQRRDATSRLAQYFVVSDPLAVRRALVLRSSTLSRSAAVARSNGLVTENVLDRSVLSADETVIAADTEGLSSTVLTHVTELDPDVLAEVDAAIATPLATPTPEATGEAGGGASLEFTDVSAARRGQGGRI